MNLVRNLLLALLRRKEEKKGSESQEFLDHDPYLREGVEEIDPRKVMKGPSFWRRLFHTFF